MHTKEGVTPKQPSGNVFTQEEATELLQFIAAKMATSEQLEAGLAKCATKEDIASIRKEMVTKDDLKKAIAESEYRLKDHVSREITKTRDVDWCLNEKTNEFVRVAQKSGTISKKDAERLAAINPLLEPAC